jgi:hypothetical protein
MEMKGSSMAQIHTFPGSATARHLNNVVPKLEYEEQPKSGPDRLCVYNESQQRFIATDVLAADRGSGGVDAYLRSVDSGSRTALWIYPCQEIPATSVRFPLDLVFLSNDCVVLQVVESFPIGDAAFPGAQATSMLAFPADSVARGDIRIGDRFIISTPEEMKRQLRRLQDAKDSVHQGTKEPAARLDRAASQAAQSAVRENPQAAVQNPAPATPTNEQAKQEAAERPWMKRDARKGWLQRLLLGDPKEPRVAPRVALPELVAYFFTGGAPTPNQVRDISTSGLYIVTSERWYIGTLIRLTLCDRYQSSAARSLTVNAKVVRWGNDGVGLEFVLDGDDWPKEVHLGPDHQTDGVDAERLKRFLEEHKRP